MGAPLAFGRQPRPLVIAHRGASAEALENTLAAFTLAHARGADAVELDVRRCGSGEVVVFHDHELARMTGHPGTVQQTSFSTLRQLSLRDGQRIPTLDEALEVLGPLLCNIELKQAGHGDDGLAAAVATILRRHDAGARTLVSSFDPLLLARFRRRAPAVPTGLLFERGQPWPLNKGWAARLLGTSAVHPEAALCDLQAVRRWQKGGMAVNVWTVDEPATLRLFCALGVDGLITNRPEVARAVVEALRPRGGAQGPA